MSKLEERENRRRLSEVSSMVNSASVASGKKERPQKDSETKKRVSLSVLPSLYQDIQKITYVQRKSVSELVAGMMIECRNGHAEDLDEYEKMQKKVRVNEAR